MTFKGTKRCSKCGEEKGVESYGRHAETKDRLRPECYPCAAAAARARRKANPDENRAYQLRLKYGLTLSDYEAMLEAQAGGCAICREACQTGRRLAVDHSHVTGRNRLLLCFSCNTAIGLLKDDPALFRAATTYLEQH